MTSRHSRLPALLLACALAGCGDSAVEPSASEESGIVGAPPAMPAPPPPPTTPTVDSEWDVATRGVPRVVTADYIELDSIARVSYFRSSYGHDYKDEFESCRSMKHYFVPRNHPNAAAIAIRSPLAGAVSRVYAEWAGWQVHIRSDSVPALTVVLFHVDLAKPLQVGDRLASGQAIGTHIGPQTSSDVAVSVADPRGFRLVSYFDAMTDEVFTRYTARGIPSRASVIITREQRDADPITCDAGRFVDVATLPQWRDLQ